MCLPCDLRVSLSLHYARFDRTSAPTCRPAKSSSEARPLSLCALGWRQTGCERGEGVVAVQDACGWWQYRTDEGRTETRDRVEVCPLLSSGFKNPLFRLLRPCRRCPPLGLRNWRAERGDLLEWSIRFACRYSLALVLRHRCRDGVLLFRSFVLVLSPIPSLSTFPLLACCTDQFHVTHVCHHRSLISLLLCFVRCGVDGKSGAGSRPPTLPSHS